MMREYDIVLYGATGFTGRLTATRLVELAQAEGLRIAFAGRSLKRVTALSAVMAGGAVACLEADAEDAAGLASLVRKTRLVISTVGPYQQYGAQLVAACATAGTDYVDLCGEPAFMAEMIQRHSNDARTSGARLVFSCGFDSVPFDLGVYQLQQEALARFGATLPRVRARVRDMKGGFSGGTAASLIATVEAGLKDPEIEELLADPFALTPGFRGPGQPKDDVEVPDPWARAWAAPFIMAAINTKTVHRSNHLLGQLYGRSFRYDEMVLTGPGEKGRARARRMARSAAMQRRLLRFGPTRSLIRQFALPKPGEGPSPEAQRSGRYDILFTGETADARRLKVACVGQGDPGYLSTSRMIAQAAACLVRDVPTGALAGGFWTPASAMGAALVRRLDGEAIRFSVEE
jgi:short subunit dehydrogenase-like uncharacterized protein